MKLRSLRRKIGRRLERLTGLASRSAERRPQSGRLPEPRMTRRDLFTEAAAGLMARPARVGLTVLGTVIGVAALVATLGLSKTARRQIGGRVEKVAATAGVLTRGARSGSGAVVS